MSPLRERRVSDFIANDLYDNSISHRSREGSPCMPHLRRFRKYSDLSVADQPSAMLKSNIDSNDEKESFLYHRSEDNEGPVTQYCLKETPKSKCRRRKICSTTQSSD
jgi:hypothetical protein